LEKLVACPFHVVARAKPKYSLLKKHLKAVLSLRTQLLPMLFIMPNPLVEALIIEEIFVEIEKDAVDGGHAISRHTR
jgi:hypothetical protein